MPNLDLKFLMDLLVLILVTLFGLRNWKRE